MPLHPGTLLGPYQITAQIGVGGMKGAAAAGAQQAVACGGCVLV